MAIEDVSVKVDLSEEKNGLIRFYINRIGYPVDIADFKALIAGKGSNQLNIDQIIRNAAINIGLSGQPIKDGSDIKVAVESETFKV